MTRRTWTLLVSLGLAVVLAVLGGVATVPYVALGPGPTFDTLGEVDDVPVVELDGVRTYPTGGQLNMTTVSVRDDITLYGALGLWFSGRHSLVPRDEIFPPDLSEEQVERQNQQLFEDSETTAENAALNYLGYGRPVVQEVTDGEAADGTLEPGDRLLAVDGTPVDSADQVIAALDGSAPGRLVQVLFQRGERPEQDVTIALGAGEERGRGYLGIAVTDRPDVDFDVRIRLGDVGGPSAGLMFALSIVDKLTPGQLAGDRFVAGTGAILPSGEVQPIGGIPFKMIRASEAGASVFLVPAQNCAEAVSRVPDGLRLIRVGSLAEGVDALDALRAGRPTPTC